MQYYIENAKYLERTYSFVPRVGLDKIKAVVVEDSEGIAARLDAAMQAAVDAYVDPWLEADQPATPNQFVSTLPVLDKKSKAVSKTTRSHGLKSEAGKFPPSKRRKIMHHTCSCVAATLGL